MVSGDGRGRHAGIQRAQGRPPAPTAPDRRSGSRPAPDGRGGQVLHRRPHAGLRRDPRAAVVLARTPRRAPRRLRARRRRPWRQGSRRQGARGVRGDRAPGPVLTDEPSIQGGSQMTSTYTVAGMTCEHCVRSVTEEVSEVPGVTAVEVDLAGGRVTVQGDADDAAVRAAVTEAGYQVVDPRP